MDIIDKGREIEEHYGHYFDKIIRNVDMDRTYKELHDTIERVQNEENWVPTSWLTKSWIKNHHNTLCIELILFLSVLLNQSTTRINKNSIVYILFVYTTSALFPRTKVINNNNKNGLVYIIFLYIYVYFDFFITDFSISFYVYFCQQF